MSALNDRCSSLSVSDLAGHVAIELRPDAGTFLRSAGPLIAGAVGWLGALLLWMRRTKDHSAGRKLWPIATTIAFSLVAGFIVYERAEYTGFGFGLGFEPWQTSVFSLGVYLLVLTPGVVALWPLWERREGQRFASLPPPPSNPPNGPRGDSHVDPAQI